MSNSRIDQLRTDYAGKPLLEDDVGEDPIALARGWLEDAVRAQLKDPNAMTLATANERGDPDARIVLLKGIEDDRFVFYSNYESAKGRQLAERPRATLLLFWPELERQVRVRGAVGRVPREISRVYFQSRPRASQLGAWASAQSEEIGSRAVLEARFLEAKERFADQEPVPLPENWGGYALTAEEIELWQGRPSRLHDRLLARREARGWKWCRLSP